MKLWSAMCSMVAGSLLAFPAHGKDGANGASEAIDDLDLMQLLNVKVSTATKTQESLDDAPAVITVVTREDIVRYGYQSVAEVLQHCVGFFVIDDHVLPNIGVRGMTGGLGAESSVVKVMIDGRSVAYRTTSGNWLGPELVSLESIKQIEIIRGPASALYGADAFLGVVNIITESPDQARPLRARGFLGTNGGVPGGQFDVAGAGHAGPWEFAAAATGEWASRNGLDLPPESPAPTLPAYVGTRRSANNLDQRALGLSARVGYRDPKRGYVNLSVFGSGFQRGGDFEHWAQLTGQNYMGQELGTVISLAQLRSNLDAVIHVSRTFDVALGATYFDGGILPADQIEIGSELFYVKRRTHYRGFDSNVEGRWVPSERFNLIGGAEIIFDHEALDAPDRIDRATGQPIVTGATGRTDNLVNVGAFVSSNLQVVPQWLKVTGGLRFDNHSIYGAQYTGRVGLTSHLARTLVAKLLYGSAFKAPSPYLLYATPLRPGDVQGNPSLRPQYIHTGEFQLSWKPSTFLAITSGVSYSLLLNKAEFTPQGINLTARNVANQKTLAWETRIDLRPSNDLNAYLAGEAIHSIRELGQEGYAATLIGTENVVYPPYILRAGGSVSLPSPASVPLQFVTEGIFVGPRRPFDTSLVQAGRDYTLDPYVLWNAGITTRDLHLLSGQETRIALRAKNILGSRGPDPGFSGYEYPLAAREFFLELQHVY